MNRHPADGGAVTFGWVSAPLGWVSATGLGRVRVPVLALLLAFGCGAEGTTERPLLLVQPSVAPSATGATTAPSNAVTSAAPPAMSTAGATASVISLTPPIIIADPNVPLQSCNQMTGGDAGDMAHFPLNHGVVPRVLYSWTTPEQIAELRSDPTLLTRSVSSEGEVGRAQGLIAELAEQGGAVATLLNSERFTNKRYAWSNPWATRLGWTGEGYGDCLLAITLRAEAWIALVQVDTAGVTWSFKDMSGLEVSIDDVNAHPERLAAMYFFDAREMPECQFERVTMGSMYREFAVMNEDMVESWSAYTDEIKAEVDSGIAALETLATFLDANQCDSIGNCWRDDTMNYWALSTPQDGLVPNYLAALAFPNDLYAPTRANLHRLLERMRAVEFDAEPLRFDAGSEVDQQPSMQPDAGAPLLQPTGDAGVGGAANAAAGATPAL